MSSRIRFAVILIGCCLALVSFPNPPKSDGQAPIKIGVVLSSTGGAARWAQHAKNGIELALAEVNAEGGVYGQPIQLVYRDCGTNGSEASKVLIDLIDNEHVSVVIGDVTSTCTVPMAQIANERKVVLITPGASYPKLSKENDFVFRYWYSDEREGTQDAWYANKNMGWRKVTTLYLDAYYGQGINEVFVREFSKLDGTIIDQIPFGQDQKDFPAQISRIVSRDPHPDGLFLVGYVNETAALLKELKSNKNTSSIPILSTQPFNILDIVEKAGGAADNVIFSVPRPPALSNKNRRGLPKGLQGQVWPRYT
jgi:branched-chain amino acid transport system substrate-binding protein